MKVLQITAPHFCAAVEFTDSGTIFNAAPILHWILRNDWSVSRTMAWAQNKGYKCEVVG